jgi:transcription elongation factor GreA
MSDILTAEGLERLINEVREIKETKLKEVAVRIKEAKDMGDLSENAEYHEAKNEQAFLYGKVLSMEKKIKNAQVIDKGTGKESIEPGCHVDVENDGDKMTFEIVGSDESDPANGRISIDSPIGTALAGHKKGDLVVVNTPSGESKYKIINIS